MNRRYTPAKSTSHKFNQSSYKYRQILTSNSKNKRKNTSRERRLLRTTSSQNFKPSTSMEFDNYKTELIGKNFIRAKIDKIRESRTFNKERLLKGKDHNIGQRNNFFSKNYGSLKNSKDVLNRRRSYIRSSQELNKNLVKKNFASSTGMKRFGSYQRSPKEQDGNFSKRNNPEYLNNYEQEDYDNNYFIGNKNQRRLFPGNYVGNTASGYFKKPCKIQNGYDGQMTKSVNLKNIGREYDLSGNMTPLSKETQNIESEDLEDDNLAHEINSKLGKLMKEIESLSNTISKISSKKLRKGDAQSVKNRSRKISENNSEKEMAMSEQLDLNSIRQNTEFRAGLDRRRNSKYKPKNIAGAAKIPVHRIPRAIPSFKEDELNYHYKGSSGQILKKMKRRKSGYSKISSKDDDSLSVNTLDIARMTPENLLALRGQIDKALKKSNYHSSRNDNESYGSLNSYQLNSDQNTPQESEDLQRKDHNYNKGEMIRSYLRPQTADSPKNLRSKNQRIQQNLKKSKKSKKKVASITKQKKYFAKPKTANPKFIKIVDRQEEGKLKLNAKSQINQNSSTNTTNENLFKKQLPPKLKRINKNSEDIEERSENEQENLDMGNSPFLNDTFPFRESHILTLSKDSITEIDHLTTNQTYVESDASILEIKKNIEQMRQGMGIPFSGNLLTGIDFGDNRNEE